MAPDGSSLLTWEAASVQTAPDGYRRIVWMIIGMIKRIRQDVGWQGRRMASAPASAGWVHVPSVVAAPRAPGLSDAEADRGRHPAEPSPPDQVTCSTASAMGAASPGDSASTALPSSQDEAAPTSARCRSRGVGAKNN